MLNHVRSGKWTAAAVVLVLGVVLLVRFLILPPPEPESRADAVVVLAGAASTRLPVALSVVRQTGGSLVISAAGGEVNASARALCGSNANVYCFTPSPANTRGEAEAIGRLVARHGWKRIDVVTSTFHVTRARLLLERCTRAQVEMVAAWPGSSVRYWTGRLVHEIGGLMEATVVGSC